MVSLSSTLAFDPESGSIVAIGTISTERRFRPMLPIQERFSADPPKCTHPHLKAEVLSFLLGGFSLPAVARIRMELRDHITGCDHCRLLMKLPTEEIAKMLAETTSSTPPN